MVREVLLVRPSACEPRSRKHVDARQVAQRIGAYLMATNRRPDGIVATPDLRSRQLAEGAVKVMGLSASAVGYAPRLRRGGGEALVAALQVLEGERLLAVGEVPGLDLPAAPLLTVAHAKTSEHRVSEVVTHDDLPVTFPFPTPTGVEERPRPAYYYFQSGAIPYRTRKTGPQVLLVTNRKGTKWMVPKGVHEPGFSAQASAAKEALEEGGVLGEVHGDAVGTYEVQKWGGTCTVTLFPLRVTWVLPADEWEESDRRRRWVPAASAAQKVKHKGLARLIARFAATLG